MAPSGRQNNKTNIIFNKVLPHRLKCHYLPRRLLNFSCSACDDFRDRILRRGGFCQSANSLVTYKKNDCQREKRGFSLIKVRVIIKDNDEQCSVKENVIPNTGLQASRNSTANAIAVKAVALRDKKQAERDAKAVATLEMKQTRAAAVANAPLKKKVESMECALQEKESNEKIL